MAALVATAPSRLNDAHTLGLLAQWGPDTPARNAILAGNAAALFGF